MALILKPKTRQGSLVVLVLIALALYPLTLRADDGYKAVTGPCKLKFPEDHGPHPGYRTEWWYYTGNVVGPSGQRFGFQLTFFRSQLMPSRAVSVWPHPASRWRTNQIFLAHAALTDLSTGKFHYHERIMREALGMAGAVQENSGTTVFVRDWSTRIGSQLHRLQARTASFRLDLALKPLKPPVLNGNEGYSLKGSSPERASCYYSLTRLQTEGGIRVGESEYPVAGWAWMDHEFSSAPLEPGLAGWDWFSLQLSDQTEVMIYLMRRKKGGFSPASSGTLVEASGKSHHLSSGDFTLQSLDVWRSPASGATYPSRWRLHIPGAKLTVTVEPNSNNQELQTHASTDVTYWEGSVSVRGDRDQTPLTGSGYVELTGYDRPFDAPM